MNPAPVNPAPRRSRLARWTTGGPALAVSLGLVVPASLGLVGPARFLNVGAPSAAAATARAGSSAPAVVLALGNARALFLDARTGEVKATVTEGLQGRSDWADAVASRDGRYLFANDRGRAQVVVFDTTTMNVVKAIDMGARNVHIYRPNDDTLIWSHSDDEGAFYLIDPATMKVVSRLVAATRGTGHGKLAYSPASSKYYATNTNEPAVFAIDGAKRTVGPAIEVCKGTDGRGGTHGKAISAANSYAYFQCSGGLAKTVVVDSRDDTVVRYLDTNGQLFPAPDGRRIVVANGAGSSLDVMTTYALNPERIESIAIPNGVDKVDFTTIGGSAWAVTANTRSGDVALVDLRTYRVRSITGEAVRNPPAAGVAIARNNVAVGAAYFSIVRGNGSVGVFDLAAGRLLTSVPLDGAVTVASNG